MLSVNKLIIEKNNEVIEEGAFQKVLAGIIGADAGWGGTAVNVGQQIQKGKYEKVLAQLKKETRQKSGKGLIAKIGLRSLAATLPIVGTVITVKDQNTLDELKADIGKILDEKEVKELVDLRERAERGQLSDKELDRMGDLEKKFWKNLDEDQKRFLTKKYQRFIKHAQK